MKLGQRFMAMLLAVGMLFTMMSPSKTTYAATEKAKETTSREKMVNLANEEYKAYGKKQTQDIKREYAYGAWCVRFITYIAEKVGVSNEIIPHKEDGVARLVKYVKNHGGEYHLKGDGYTPKPGDILIYSNKSHAGLIVKVDSKGTTSIEGNTSLNYGDNTVGYMNEKVRGFNSSLIEGYLVPAYNDDDIAKAEVVTETEKETDEKAEAVTAYPYYGSLSTSSQGWTKYTAAKNYNMSGNAGTLKEGAKLVVLETGTSSKGNRIAKAYSLDLKKVVYVAEKFITRSDEAYEAKLDITSKKWTTYIPGENFEMGGNGGTLKNGAKLLYLSEKKNSKGNVIAQVYSTDLGKVVYVTKKYVVK